MIEIEKKFALTKENSDKLIKDAAFLSERVFTDTYYDNDKYELTTKDTWLRMREGKFELKIPLKENKERIVDQYTEIEDENEIRKALKIPKEKELTEDLQKAGYKEFCTCKTTRRKYKKETFTIDLDMVEYDGYTYHIGEIELMAENETQAKEALNKIIAFAKKHKISFMPVRGKVVEFLRLNNQDHYKALVKAGVVKE